jgi:beta-glucanase (GH16 family)
MRNIPFALVLLLGSAVAAAPPARWRLVWSDEFEGPANSPPDSSKWGYDLGGGGWGNRELEFYTSDPNNVFLNGEGSLVIRAIRESSGTYTSARLKTKGRFEVRYGKIEARLKLPIAPTSAVWPAFWALGNDIDTVSWPHCGEIDVMENISRESTVLHGTVHGPGYSGDKGITGQTAAQGRPALGDDFHVYGVEWGPESIVFFLDGRAYLRVTPESLPSGTQWVFSHPFFLLLNLAVGGQWPGYPAEDAPFPQTMLVDWVRVWQAVPTPPSGRRLR